MSKTKTTIVFGTMVTSLLCMRYATAIEQTAALANATPNSALVLGNRRIVREFAYDGHVWRTVKFARADGSDSLPVQSDEFLAVLMDGAVVTLDAYEVEGKPKIVAVGNEKRLAIRYTPRTGGTLPTGAPSSIELTYVLCDNEPWTRKQVTCVMRENDAIDRLEVERFSTGAKAERGGRGQPVFLDGTWFTGLEYPAGHSRHTDGNTPATSNDIYCSFGDYPNIVDLEGHDVDTHPRPGLVRLMHFPGYAKQTNGIWTVAGKTAVLGAGMPGNTVELAFNDYFDAVRLKPRSFVNYNNWYDNAGKNLSVNNFADRIGAAFVRAMKPYGVTIDALVPDNYWQSGKGIYEPGTWAPRGTESIADLATALEKQGTGLGLWLSLDGAAALNIDEGVKAYGYVAEPGIAGYGHYSLAQRKYFDDLKARLKDLITRCHIRYFKHDFNSMNSSVDMDGHNVTVRHGHEAAVDAELALLDWERACNTNIHLKVTNFIWFSPWWFQHCHVIWMLAGDTGYSSGLPEPSSSVMAAAYRDEHLFRVWGNPATRPLVPLAQIMTHGIIKTASVNRHPEDTLRGFSDHVVMYHMRGTLPKEWYLQPEVLSQDEWDVLGRVTRWSTEHQQTLVNSVMLDGNPATGPHGYVAWNTKGTEGIVSLRNPLPTPASIEVPFDTKALYRGPIGRDFAARVIYPWQGPLGMPLRSGSQFRVAVPGYTVMVVQLAPGTDTNRMDIPLPSVAVQATATSNIFHATIAVPDERMQSCVLLVTVRDQARVVPEGCLSMSIQGKSVASTRDSFSRAWNGPVPGWRMMQYDLMPYRGTTVSLVASVNAMCADAADVDAVLLLDRPVADLPAIADVRLPRPIAQGFRRQTVPVLARTTIAATVRPITAGDLTNIVAAKLRIGLFGVQTSVGGELKLELNSTTFTIPNPDCGDQWTDRQVEIPSANLQLTNTVRILRAASDDKFKIGHIRLMVHLADGTSGAVSSSAIQTSHADWAFKEGDVFETPARSQPFTLAFHY